MRRAQCTRKKAPFFNFTPSLRPEEAVEAEASSAGNKKREVRGQAWNTAPLFCLSLSNTHTHTLTNPPASTTLPQSPDTHLLTVVHTAAAQLSDSRGERKALIWSARSLISYERARDGPLQFNSLSFKGSKECEKKRKKKGLREKINMCAFSKSEGLV